MVSGVEVSCWAEGTLVWCVVVCGRERGEGKREEGKGEEEEEERKEISLSIPILLTLRG